MLCHLAQSGLDLTKALTGPAGSLEDALRVLAATGDCAAFEDLPPVLMHNSETVTAQKLWGGLQDSHVAGSTYTPGAPKPPGSSERLLGAAMMTLNEMPHPVLLYLQPGAIVARVYDVPFAALESELYNHRDGPTPLETKWKGPSLAAAHVELFESIGAHMKEGGLACMPGYIFSTDQKSFHLARPGPVPFLHMRAPATDTEFESMETLVHAALIDAAMPNEGDEATPIRPDDVLLTSISAQVKAMMAMEHPVAEMLTIFSRAPHPGRARVANDPVSESTDRVTMSTKICRNPALITACVAMLDIAKPSDLLLAKVDKIVEEIGRADLEPGSVRGLQCLNTLSSLTNRSGRLCTVRRIGAAGITDGWVVASSVFAASDVGLAVRELSSDVQPMVKSGVVGMMWNLAKRVDEVCAMLCIEMGPGRDIRSMRLINSCVDYELDIDCAARLLDCPWVAVVMHLTTTQEPGGFFTIETAGVCRDMLKVCDSVRKTYGLEAQRHVRTPAAPPLDFGEFDKRLKSLEGVLKTMQEAPTTLAPAPTPAPVPVSTSTSVVSYTSPELEKLRAAQKKWNQLGKRPRAS